jgi:hypothetical protein
MSFIGDWWHASLVSLIDGANVIDGDCTGAADDDDDGGFGGNRVNGTIPLHISVVGGCNELVHMVFNIHLGYVDIRVNTVDGIFRW